MNLQRLQNVYEDGAKLRMQQILRKYDREREQNDASQYRIAHNIVAYGRQQ